MTNDAMTNDQVLHPRRKRKTSFARLMFACGLVIGMWSLVIPHVTALTLPPNDGYITDAAGILTADQDRMLELTLTEYKNQTSNEIAVVILKSLEGEQEDDVALQIGRKWGIGSKEKSNGILLLFSYEDRRARIEVGYGLEGAVPDIVAKGIIDKDLAPRFREGKYYEGIAAAIDSLQKHIGGEYSADRYEESATSSFSPLLIIILLVAFQWLLAILGRSKSWWLGGVLGGVGGLVLAFLYTWWLSIPILVVLGLGLDYLVSRNYQSRGKTSWWAGGGWGSGGGGSWGGGSGGGFGGFGGGGFGGGGASGQW